MEDFKVLLLEDDESARMILARTIKKEGFTVLSAENGRIGMEIFEKEKPQIIISDLKMPEMSGLEVLKNIKKISPRTQFILMTAFGEVDTAVEALREGALDYIKKPIDLDVLTLALGRAKEKITEDKELHFTPNILLAEDDGSARELLVKMLKKEGWNIFSAVDGQESLDIFKREKIDIVLTDIKMPKLDGLSALHEMRKITDDFECVIMSGFGDEGSAIKAMHEGAMNFLKKPIDLENLLVLVEKAMEKLQITRALKYRTREVELANQVIARITGQKEIIVDFGSASSSSSRLFAQNIIDSIPLKILVVDQNLNVHLSNNRLNLRLGYIPKILDEKFIKDLEKAGIKDLKYSDCINLLKETMSLPLGKLESISFNKTSFLTMIPLFYFEHEAKGKLVAIIIRQEINLD